MHKLGCWICIIALLLSLCACGTQESTETTVTKATAGTTATEAEVVTTEGGTTVTTVTNITETQGITSVTEQPGTGSVSVTTAQTTSGKTKKTTVTKTTKTTASATTVPPTYGVTLYGPQNGTVIDPMTPMVRAYMDITDAQEAAEFWVASYTENDNGASFTITWKYHSRARYQVLWADNAELKDAQSSIVTGGSFSITGVPHGTNCYFKVMDMSNKQESEVRYVRILDGQVRWIDAEGCRNVRDLGGWKTESGKTVRYGMLYRGACIDGYNGIELTAFGKQQFREMLGIKTQLDLRGSDDGDDGEQMYSDFGGKYVKATFDQYDYIFKNTRSHEALGKIFDVLSDEANYPIYFHCNAGSDRTGTLAFIINGLLGVSYEDLTRDFELTGFSIGKRLRSALDMSGNEVAWDKSGVMQNDSGNYIAWGPLYDKMMSNFGTGDGKLSSAIENFLMTKCGVTKAEIDEVRRLMLQ